VPKVFEMGMEILEGTVLATEYVVSSMPRFDFHVNSTAGRTMIAVALDQLLHPSGVVADSIGVVCGLGSLNPLGRLGGSS
jgi:hypothetical protein